MSAHMSANSVVRVSVEGSSSSSLSTQENHLCLVIVSTYLRLIPVFNFRMQVRAIYAYPVSNHGIVLSNLYVNVSNALM